MRGIEWFKSLGAFDLRTLGPFDQWTFGPLEFRDLSREEQEPIFTIFKTNAMESRCEVRERLWRGSVGGVITSGSFSCLLTILFKLVGVFGL